METTTVHLIREQYPFPIAYAYKKLQARLDDDAHKLHLLVQTAEVTVQYLALVTLAQLRHDLEHRQAPALGREVLEIPERLRRPAFGTWHGICRDVLKHYHAQRDALVISELFDWYFQPTRRKTLAVQPCIRDALEPLIELRNDVHHNRLAPHDLPARLRDGLGWLDQVLTTLDFLSAYDLVFVQRISVDNAQRGVRRFRHDLLQLHGCASVFDQQRWEADADLPQGHVIVLAHDAQSRSLLLDPFLVLADQLPVSGVLDLFLLGDAEE